MVTFMENITIDDVILLIRKGKYKEAYNNIEENITLKDVEDCDLDCLKALLKCVMEHNVNHLQFTWKISKEDTSIPVIIDEFESKIKVIEDLKKHCQKIGKNPCN